MHPTRLATLMMAALLVLGAARDAAAFKQSVHRSITDQSCQAAGLPRAFCSRIATEAYNTDGNEWDDLLAHAQMSTGESLCTAANRVQARMRSLGEGLRDAVDRVARGDTDSVAAVGQLAGRAAHTLQDSYAHHGMSNPEHAWFTLQDMCQGTSSAPDLRPGAEALARAATDTFLAGVRAAIDAAAVAAALAGYSCPQPTNPDDPNARGVCDTMYGAAPWEACSFLGEAEKWDGVDRQWDNSLVGPSLVAAFVDDAAYDLCMEPALAAPPVARVDVSGGTPSCGAVHLMCLGKADGEGTEPAADAQMQGGCAVSRAGGQALPGALALAFLLLIVGRALRR
jgi:hypothetical protein